MKKIVSIVTVLFSLVFLSPTAFAEQNNFSEDEKPIVFELIKKNDQNAGSVQPNKKDSVSHYPKTGEVKTMIFSFLGSLLLGLIFIIFLKRRSEDEQEK